MAEGRREVTKSKMDLLDSEVYGDFSFPLSVPSQPPDIRNWFSSYESQELLDLDTIKDVNGFDENEEDEIVFETQDLLEDSTKNKHQERNKEDENEEDEIVFETQDPLEDSRKYTHQERDKEDVNGFDENEEDEIVFETQDPLEDSRKNKHQERDKEDCFSSEKSPSKLCEENLEIKFRPLSKINLEDQIHNEKFTGNNSVIKKKRSLKQLLGEEFLIGCEKIINNQSCLSETEAPKENYCYMESTQEKLTIKDENFDSIDSDKTCVEQWKENPTTNGFVSVKCKAIFSKEQENSTEKGNNRRGFSNELKEKTNFEKKNLEENDFRTPVMGKINYSFKNEIIIEELSGKWKCPQKTKPYVGPPLKQLRIEQWLNRAT